MFLPRKYLNDRRFYDDFQDTLFHLFMYVTFRTDMHMEGVWEL